VLGVVNIFGSGFRRFVAVYTFTALKKVQSKNEMFWQANLGEEVGRLFRTRDNEVCTGIYPPVVHLKNSKVLLRAK
jgi:hypothetical protein